MPTIYHNLLHSQARVEDAIDDVKAMLREHAVERVAGDTEIPDWELEWIEQVQNLLEMDAGWGQRGFWAMIAHNLRVSVDVARHYWRTCCSPQLTVACHVEPARRRVTQTDRRVYSRQDTALGRGLSTTKGICRFAGFASCGGRCSSTCRTRRPFGLMMTNKIQQ